MIELSLSKDQQLLLEGVGRFARALRDAQRATEKEGVGAALRRSYQDLSLQELDWPKALGGFELDRRTRLLVVEELAFGDAGAAFALDRVALVCSPLLRIEAVAAKVKAAIDQGGESFTPAFYVDTDERLTIDGDTIKGALAYLPAARCDRLYVVQGNRLFSLRDGVRLEPVRGVFALDAAGASSVTLDATAEWSATLTELQALVLKGLWRLHLAAMMVGVSRAAFEHARAFCMDRIAFGKKVAHHQAVAFLFADMATAIEGARLLVHGAAASADAGSTRCPLDLQLAFLQAAECAQLAGPNGVQLLGSAGYVKDHPVEKWMREARALALLAGGVDGAQNDAGRAFVLLPEAA